MRRLGLLVGALLCLALLGRAARRVPAPSPTEHFGRGDCAACHKDPPRYHAESRWDINHGRTPLPVRARCGSCHAATACQACHDLAPATHTADFRRPGTGSPGALRHALIGRAQPGSCLVCHRDLMTACTGCHTPGEARALSDKGRRELAPWQGLLEGR